MKKLSLSLLAAAAALALQACDIRVHDTPSSGSTAAVSEQPAPASSSESTTASSDTSTTTAASSASAPAGSASMPADQTAGAGMQSPSLESPPLSPNTSEMGANAPAQPGAQFGTAPAMDATAGGTAAPTELARFLEQNPPGVRKQEESASKKPDGDKAGKTEAKRDTAKDTKS